MSHRHLYDVVPIQRLLLPLLLACLPCASGCTTPPPDAHNFEPGERQIARRARDVSWGPGPASVPFACEMAVLEGDPKAKGLFTIRLRTRDPWIMPPHLHPRAERVTVLSGAIHVGFGTSSGEDAADAFTEGDYYVNAPDTAHYVWADGPVEIQITGIGPWEVQPVD